jgi:hypothetical protein
MAFTQPFNRDILSFLTSLGYRYLAVEPSKLMIYARKEKTADYALELLGMKEYEIATMKPHIIAVFEMYNLELILE